MADVNGNKTGGRTKGVPNKIQSKTKDFLKGLIEDNQEKIMEELSKLDGKAYLDAVNNLMVYVEPKLSSVAADLTSDGESISTPLIEFVSANKDK